MQNQVDFTFRDLLKAPLDQKELAGLAKAGNTTVKAMINTRSQVFKKSGVNRDDLDEAAAIAMVMENPRILIRPVVTGRGVFISGFSEAQFQSLV